MFLFRYELAHKLLLATGVVAYGQVASVVNAVRAEHALAVGTARLALRAHGLVELRARVIDILPLHNRLVVRLVPDADVSVIALVGNTAACTLAMLVEISRRPERVAVLFQQRDVLFA